MENDNSDLQERLAKAAKESESNTSYNTQKPVPEKKKGKGKYVVGALALAALTFFGIRSGIGINDSKNSIYEKIANAAKTMDPSYQTAEERSAALQDSLRQDSLARARQSELEKKLAEEEQAKLRRSRSSRVSKPKPKPKPKPKVSKEEKVRDFLKDLRKQPVKAAASPTYSDPFDKINDKILDDLANYLINIGGYDETPIIGIDEMDKRFYNFAYNHFVVGEGKKLMDSYVAKEGGYLADGDRGILSRPEFIRYSTDIFMKMYDGRVPKRTELENMCKVLVKVAIKSGYQAYNFVEEKNMVDGEEVMDRKTVYILEKD